MKKKRILVCAYFAKNIGDDLFLKILFDRYQNVEWDLLTANRNYNEIFRDYKNVNIIYTYREISFGKRKYNLFFKINELFLNFKKYDALVNIGGSIFMQSPAWKVKFDEREYLVKKFKEMGKKAFIIGANFGPFIDEDYVQKYRELFTNYDDICFRDNYSYNLFKELDNVRLAYDVVFNLNKMNNDIKDKCVGFSIINLEGREGLKEFTNQYNEKIIQVIEKCLKMDYSVKLFSFCENEGDLKVINKIKNHKKLKDINQVEVVNYVGKIDSFLKEFKSCEVIIGTRFHSIILGLLLNQAVFPIIYSDKTFNVLKDLKIESNCCYIKDIETLNINDILVSSEQVIRIKNDEVSLEAERQFEKLDLLIG